jgi:aspartyl-tRNA(Asn)/glutamyl-tRNA(Gln) amidotransferase subunit A
MKKRYIMKTETSKIDPIYYQDASALAKLIRTGELSPVEVVKAHLDRIKAHNPDINAIVTVAGNALAAAKVAEAAGKERR